MYNVKLRKLNANSIRNSCELIQNNLFKENIDENTPFFFNVKFDEDGIVKLNNGSEESHINIMITSKKLLRNLESENEGPFHIDATYKLIKNKFPVVVFAKTDFHHQIHPIAFVITSHEQTKDYVEIYKGLISVSDQLNIEFNPEYIIQDAWDASYNAAKELFPECKVLMCWYHVRSNCYKHRDLIPIEHRKDLGLAIRAIHFSKDKYEAQEKYVELRENFSEVAPKFISYFKDNWLKGNFNRWKIYSSPPGYSSTNSPLESFNNSIKRDHTQRKQLSVLEFLKCAIRMVEFYSVNKKDFLMEPKISSQMKKQSKIFAKKEFYNRLEPGVYEFDNEDGYHGTFKLNSRLRYCSCKYYLKYKICSHLHGLDLLKIKIRDTFVNLPKKGRPKNSTKALEY